jgi:hypothetical protein
MAIHDRAFRPGTTLADEGRRHRPHGHRGLAPDQESVLGLQRLAGNAAVSRALAEGRSGDRVTSVDAMTLTREGMAPDKGISQIRGHAGGASVLAYTKREIEDRPPIMLPEPAAKVEGGYAAKAQKVGSVPEPVVNEWWPKQGRHKVAENQFVQVEDTWEKKLEQGEDEHGDDAKLSWELTWKVVQDTINRFAAAPGPVATTPEDAEKALWKRYVAALPSDLRPTGDKPSPARQLEVLAVKPGTFFAWMWEATVSRDSRNYHSTKTVPSMKATDVPKGAAVNEIDGYQEFLVPGPTPKEHLKEMRAKYTPGKVNVASKMK